MLAAQSVVPVNVCVRLRPFSQDELRSEEEEGNAPAWRVSGSKGIEEIRHAETAFQFDAVHDMQASTATVYQTQLASIPLRVAQGLNGTIMAYGQTGSGKSFTMLGDEKEPRGTDGVVVWAVRDLFSALDSEMVDKPNLTTVVFLSIIEIYNEQLKDLLLVSDDGSTPIAQTLSIREKKQGMYVHHALRRRVRTAKECIDAIFDRVEGRRFTAATAMNERSSRSHCVISIDVERLFMTILEAPMSLKSPTNNQMRADDEVSECSESMGTFMEPPPANRTVFSTLHLVDLAGSERVSKTGATGIRMVEGGYINKSLSTLTTVTQRLCEAVTNPKTFVPFRDSKLTHLLKTALGGNAMTTIVVCVSPSLMHVDDSRSALQFASRAKQIRNRVGLNEIVDPELRVKELEELVASLTKKLTARTLSWWSAKLRVSRLSARLDEELKRRGGSGTARVTGRAASAVKASHDALLASVDREVRSGSTVEDVRAEREQLFRSFQELDGLCRELERENTQQEEIIRELKSQVRGEKHEMISAGVCSAIVEHHNEEEGGSASCQQAHTDVASSAASRHADPQKEVLTGEASSATVHAQASRSGVLQSAHAAAIGGGGGRDGGTASVIVEEEKERLESRVRELENLLLEKDAVRDAIIDTKLSRMQDLTVYLFRRSERLGKELRRVAAERNALFVGVQAKKPDCKALSKKFSSSFDVEAAIRQIDNEVKSHAKPHGHN